MPPHCGFDLDEYLTSTVEKLNSGKYSSLHIVVGNESCDLDSAVCALVLAAFMHWQHQRIKCKVCTRNKRAEDAVDDIFVPVLNVDREDYAVKTEVAYCFREHGVDEINLVFRDDAALSSSPADSVTLVDHHTLAARDAALAERVTEIIDHRPIDKSAWSFPADARVTIETVGSCATLVTRRIADLSALLAERDEFLAADTRLADMLHSTIILDTANFSPALQKGTPLDDEMASLLEGVMAPPADLAWGKEREDKLSRLVSARADVSALTGAQLLRKDSKVEGDVLVPSLPLLVKEFLLRNDSVSSVSAALARTGCSAVVLLGIDLKGGLRRDAAVYCPDEERREKLISHLLAWTPSFELSADASPEQSRDASPDQLRDTSLRYFSQHNLSASRKQYMPAIKHFLTIV